MRIDIQAHTAMGDINRQLVDVKTLSQETMDFFREEFYWRSTEYHQDRFRHNTNMTVLDKYRRWAEVQPINSAEPVQVAFWLQDDVMDDLRFTEVLTSFAVAYTTELGRDEAEATARVLLRELSQNDGHKQFLDPMADVATSLAATICKRCPQLAAGLAEVTSHVRLRTGAPDKARDRKTYRQAMINIAKKDQRQALHLLTITSVMRGNKDVYSPRCADATGILENEYAVYPSLDDKTYVPPRPPRTRPKLVWVSPPSSFR